MSGIEKSDLVAEFTCGSDQRAELAALQLSAAGSQGLEILAELLEDQNPEVRWWATRSLADIHNTVAVPLLLNTINDTDSGVQQCAALALRGQPDAQSIPQLVSLLGAEDRLLSRLAGDALIAIGEEAVPALIEVMDSGPQPAQLEAVRALASIGDTRAIPALINLVKAQTNQAAIITNPIPKRTKKDNPHPKARPRVARHALRHSLLRSNSRRNIATGMAIKPPMGGKIIVPAIPAISATIIVSQDAPPWRAPAPIRTLSALIPAIIPRVMNTIMTIPRVSNPVTNP
jgi:hypothetical protein